MPAEPVVAAPETTEAPESEAVFDQELEGIDLAELDSILEQESDPAASAPDIPEPAAEVVEAAADFDEADLDIDFEAALMDVAAEAPVEADATQSDELDLDMDFKLDGDDDLVTDGSADQPQADQASDNNIPAVAGGLDHDINMVLDDFEDSLGQPGTGPDDTVEITDADFDLDFSLDGDPIDEDEAAQDNETAVAPGEDGDTLGLDDSGALLAASDTPIEEAAVGEVELSLDDGEELFPDDTRIADKAPAAAAEDDLDLGDLGALLGDDDEAEEAEIGEVELSLDDGDDLSLDDGQGAEETPAAAEAEDDLDLGDFGALLDDDDQAEQADVEDVELSLDDGAAPSEEPSLGGDDLDLGDLDSLLDDDDDADEAEPQEVELSLDDGLDVSLDDAAGVAGEVPAIAADDLDLGDLESMLDEDDALDEDGTAPESAPEAAQEEEVELSLADGDEEPSFDDSAPKAEAPAAISDDLDLGDLDSLLDDDGEEVEVEDVELSLDDAGVPAAADAASLPSEDDLDLDGLDLSDLDDMLEEDAAQVNAADDLELTLDVEPASAQEDNGQDDEIEDLEFELDAEFEDKPLSQTDNAVAPQEVEEAADEELDLSDIEQMLEDDTLAEGATGAGAADGAEKWLEDQEDDLGMDAEGEIDLSEIEEAIDAADNEIDATDLLDDDEGLELDLELDTPGSEAEELDLELEMESDVEPMQIEEGQEESDELDLSDLDLSSDDSKSSTTTETIDGGDIELEFQIEDTGPLLEEDDEPQMASASTTSAASAQTTEVVHEPDFSLEETIATTPIGESERAALAIAPRKKGASKSLLVILLLALLGGGGYLGYDYVIKNDIQIPYLSDYINPKPKDPTGTVNLSTLEINSKFLENEKSGRLFIVTGKVRNGNKVPCKMVRLQGKLFTKGKVLAKTEQTFAGVIIPDQELASNSLVDIKKQLNAPLGAAAGAQVMAGQTIPFMVVFSELPDDLDEFAIELVSATKIE